ncbi:MAG: DUF1638 domain-containing protein [Gammaproteobacteria bacterium]
MHSGATAGAQKDRSLVIACGALAHEITALKRLNQWDHLTIECLPASLHNRPEHIAPRVKEKIEAARGLYRSIFVAYADCGTGGLLDKALQGEDIARLPGAHCYEFFWGSKAFLERLDAEPGVFYLTDFLAQHFERLIMQDLGIRKHPELLDLYFGNYTHLVFLSQSPSPQTIQMARQAADALGLPFQHIHTGYGDLEKQLNAFAGQLAS